VRHGDCIFPVPCNLNRHQRSPVYSAYAG
jgi:hypothetical protein